MTLSASVDFRTAFALLTKSWKLNVPAVMDLAFVTVSAAVKVPVTVMASAFFTVEPAVSVPAVMEPA